MTLPQERTRAVIELAREIQALAPYMHGKSETVRVPREALRRLLGWLRHYPMPVELTMTAKAAPHLWAPAGNDCHKTPNARANLTDTAR